MIYSIQTFLLVPLLTLALLVSGCSHQKIEKRLDERLEQESGIRGSVDLNLEAATLIEKSTQLSAEQRSRLYSVVESLHARLKEMRDESWRLQSILIKDLFDTPYNSGEVQAIEERLIAREEKKVAAIIEAVERANGILGHGSLYHQRVLQALINEAYSGREE